jgi:hypothetical protein
MSNPERPRKRSPKEIIEEAQPANVEHSFSKHPGEEVKHTAKGTTYETPSSILEYGHNIHTHPSHDMGNPLRNRALGPLMKGHALHSPGDLRSFLLTNGNEFATVAVRNPLSGEVIGYSVLKKTKETPAAFTADSSVLNLKHDFELINFSAGRVLWAKIFQR